jgi:hypothetical protein
MSGDDDRFWHLASIRPHALNGRYWVHSGHCWILARVASVAFDPMYGPAVRCKWILPSWR